MSRDNLETTGDESVTEIHNAEMVKNTKKTNKMKKRFNKDLRSLKIPLQAFVISFYHPTIFTRQFGVPVALFHKNFIKLTFKIFQRQNPIIL